MALKKYISFAQLFQNYALNHTGHTIFPPNQEKMHSRFYRPRWSKQAYTHQVRNILCAPDGNLTEILYDRFTVGDSRIGFIASRLQPSVEFLQAFGVLSTFL